jgi:S-DNA-T family DNA segregation ATPase FtsK/SpoIIIE
MPRLVEPDAKPLPPGIVPFKGIAVLGLCDDGAPRLLRLPSPDVAHVLIAGTTGSGKTALCQTMILSLAMTHRRSQLQFVLAEGPKRHAFKPFARLPHLLRPVIGDATEAVDALRELVRLMEARRVYPLRVSWGAQGETLAPARSAGVTPRILVVLDELADLTYGANAGGKALNEHLTRLVQRGREARIHVMACTHTGPGGQCQGKPSSQVMGTLIRANFPVRLVGKVVSPDAYPLRVSWGSRARVAAGIGGTGAEKLTGRGDFVAIAAGQVIRFQAAYVSAAEMDQVVAQMGSTPRRWDVVGGRPSLLHQAVALVAGAG